MCLLTIRLRYTQLSLLTKIIVFYIDTHCVERFPGHASIVLSFVTSLCYQEVLCRSGLYKVLSNICYDFRDARRFSILTRMFEARLGLIEGDLRIDWFL